MIKRFFIIVTASALVSVGGPAARAQQTPDPSEIVNGLPDAGASLAARDAEPIILQGAQLPGWAGVPSEGAALPWPNGAVIGERSAHNGELLTPPATGVPVDEIAAYAYRDGRFVEIPVQVDERFPYFLANPNSDFGLYSATDEELTYAWDVESWKKTAGLCEAEYPEGESAMKDPAVGLDADDEIVFMSSDAGEMAPTGAKGPVGTLGEKQLLTITDPTNGALGFVYLFRKPGGSSYDEDNGYVTYKRDANADQWIDRTFFAADDPEKLGTSNSGYGPNLSGTVCPDGTPASAKPSNDRFPRDGVTVSTDSYEWYASGRWMMRNIKIAKPNQPGVYGPDLVDRWKGRAFQSSPDSTISVVGFEDEQVNWEGNAALLGERAGPVRAIRETWGADSGTNVTKTEFFYRDVIAYHYHVRVHPIPPDGLYQSWDYNAGVAAKYYNTLKPEGVDIDGVNDDMGNVDELPTGQPAFFDVNDPTFNLPLATLNWQQVSGVGDAGSLVYITEMDAATSAENPVVMPFYRDDKCFDDGTGDDPVARPWPGEHSQDGRVKAGYAENAGVPYDQVTCDQRQGAWGSHGVHYFFAGDTDNAFQSKQATEIEATEWQFTVPTEEPTNVGAKYGAIVQAPSVVAAAPQPNTALVGSSLEISEPAGGQATDAATVEATLSDADGPIAGATVTFTLDGATEDTTTDASGVAEASFDLGGPARTTTVSASYEGDADHGGASDSAPFTVGKETPALQISEPAGGAATDDATVAATLLDGTAPIAGKAVTFEVQGQTLAATTDANGLAEATFRVSAPAGQTPLTASFAGDDTYEAASDEASFTVARDVSKLSFTATKRDKKNRSKISARIVDADSDDPLVNASLDVLVDNKKVATLITNADGNAVTTIRLPKAKRPLIEVRFDGNSAYAGAVASARHDPKTGASATS